MMGITQISLGAPAVSLVLQTADPALLFVGAIASLLPDVDTSVSPAGKALPWVSHWLEQRMPHRSCTHSLMASAALALVTYPVAVLANLPLNLIHAINIGFFAGWFADAFTRNGIEMFYPSTTRCVLPGNRNLRLRTGSSAEYGLLLVIVAIAAFSININANGGMLTQFNRLIASPTGVEQLYNEKGSNHLMVAHIRGVRSSDRAPVSGDFWIVQAQGQGFIVQSKAGEIYKAGTEPDCQLIAEHITAEPGVSATTNIETLKLEEEELASKLEQFERSSAMVFVSGRLNVENLEDLQLTTDPYQFQTIRASGNSINLEAAPLKTVQQTLGEQFATGLVTVRSIYAQSQATSNLNPDS